MRRPNPDKARRAIERSHAHMREQEQARWLTSLTPEHRAFHERGTGLPCGVCIGAIGTQLRESIARLKMGHRE